MLDQNSPKTDVGPKSKDPIVEVEGYEQMLSALQFLSPPTYHWLMRLVAKSTMVVEERDGLAAKLEKIESSTIRQSNSACR